MDACEVGAVAPVVESVVLLDWRVVAPGDGVNGRANDREDFSHVPGLAESIRAYGQATPIKVTRAGPDGLHRIIEGGSRWRACKLLDQPVRAIVVDADEEQQAALMLLENVARKQLGILEEARAYQSRLDAGWTAERLKAVTGQRLDYIERRLSLLRLVAEAQELVNSGNLEASYAFALAEYGLDSNRQRLALRALRECPSPTLGWWRGVLAELQTQQAQDGAGSLFDLAIFDAAERVADVLPVAAYKEPGLPGRDYPPCLATGPRAMLLEQAAYWRAQAQAWERLGKPGNRDKCEGASIALENAGLALPADPPLRAAGEAGKRRGVPVRARTVSIFAAGLAD